MNAEAWLNTAGRIAWFDDFSDDPTNQCRFLSNFYVGEPIRLSGWGSFMTGEHAFQAFKAVDKRAFESIAEAPSPAAAKAWGRKCTLRPDWEAVKYDVMAAIIRAKFTLEREEGRMLVDTRDALLVEGTYWRDRVWGVDLALYTDRSDPSTAPGRNWLGTLLMARRAELVAEASWNEVTSAGQWNLEFVTESS